jgi:hypothetical protein
MKHIDERHKDGKWHMIEGSISDNTVTWMWRKWTSNRWQYTTLSHELGEEKPDPNN